MDWYSADLVEILCACLWKKPRSKTRNTMMMSVNTPKRIVSCSLWFLNMENRSMLNADNKGLFWQVND